MKTRQKKGLKEMKKGLPILVVVTLMAAGCFPLIPGGDVYRSAMTAAGEGQPIDIAKFRPVSVKPATAVLQGDEYLLDNGADKKAVNGIQWTKVLNQTSAVPFVFSAESLFEAGTEINVSGSDYSIYLDVHYQDGTSLYGRNFGYRARQGLGWQRGTVIVSPDKPIKDVSCYLLLRNRDGRVRFRNPRCQVYSGATLALFDTSLVQVVNSDPKAAYLLHDAADSTDGWTAMQDGTEAKGFRLGMERTERDDAMFFKARLDSLTDADRAMTFACTIPLPEEGELTWLHDPRTEMPMDDKQCFRNAKYCGCGAGMLSIWPFGAVRAGNKVFAIGYDPDAPAIFRVVGSGRLRRLFISFDLGFAKEKKDATFKFVAFELSGKKGFRDVLEKYAQLFPEYYKVRIKKHGIWMAFRPISKVEGWEDFGFAMKEGDGETAWDDAHGILTTHYTEPTSWWMGMKDDGDPTMEKAIAQARRMAEKTNGHPFAKAWVASTYHDQEGEITGAICDRPWCKGVCWNMNSLPGIPGGEYQVKHAQADYDKRYAGKTFPEGVDGEYIDSAECHLPPKVDFRRENFKYSKTPLCWASDTFKPGVSSALAIYEYVRGASDRCHAMGRILQANGAPYTWPWLIPFVDYGGQETKWIVKGEGEWKPMEDELLLYRTAMAYGKPYCFLMNVKFENLTDEMVEKYFQRCLAYGLMSSFFSPNASGDHFFTRPDMYNRHRHFFLKYGKLQRQVSEAGWRAVNRLAVSETAEVFTEQFGNRYVTVFNPTGKPIKATIRCLTDARSVTELICGTEWKFDQDLVTVEIPAETVRLLDFGE